MYLIFSDGYKTKVPNQFLIQPFKNRYLRLDATFIDGDERIEVPFTTRCDSCGKDYSEFPVTQAFLSEDSALNRKLNRIGRVCVICYYRPYYEAGHKIPPPLARFF